MASATVATKPTQIDKIAPLGNWTVVAIGLAAKKKRQNAGPLVILHRRDIRQMLANLYRVLGMANLYRAKAMNWVEPEEAEELDLIMAKLHRICGKPSGTCYCHRLSM
jgi:hypothetical protein